MVAWIDTLHGRVRTAGIGILIAFVGIALYATSRLVWEPLGYLGIAASIVGTVVVIWAFVHPTRAGLPVDNRPVVYLEPDVVNPVRIFISYSHFPDDSRLVFRLVDYVEERLWRKRVLIGSRAAVSIHCDRRVSKGTEWQDKFNESLFQDANYILLIVSPDYLASEYCVSQMNLASVRQQASSSKLIPVILCPVEWEPQSDWKSLPTNGQPVTSWPNVEEAFADIAEGIIKAFPAVLQKWAP